MKIWKKSVIAATVLAVALPAAAFAATPKSEMNAAKKLNRQIEELRNHQSKAVESLRQSTKSSLQQADNLGIHKKTYLTLLAEKYAPATVNDWNTVFAERERLLNELKALKPTLEEKQEQKDLRKNEKEDLRKEWQEGNLDLNALKQKMEELKSTMGSLKDLKVQDWMPLIKERAELQQTFTDAVTSGDGGKIADSLAQQLAQTKTENSRLADILAKLKEKKAESSPSSVPAV